MEKLPSFLPVLPIRNALIFPAVSLPLAIGRNRSIKALEKAEKSNGFVLVVAQRALTTGDPEPADLYSIGTACKIEGMSQAEAGSRQVVVTGVARFEVEHYQLTENSYLTGTGRVVPDILDVDPIRGQAIFNSLKSLTREILELLPSSIEPLLTLVDQVEDPSYLTHICGAYLNLSLHEKQELLETPQVTRRMELLLNAMRREREVLSVQREIRDKMAERMNQTQREALLREQIRTIRSELGEEPGEDVAEKLEQKLKEARLPEDAQKQAAEELQRFRSMPNSSAEYHVIRSYLEWMAALPWSNRTVANLDVHRARAILDQDHYGMENVKKRILQFLAVARLKNDLHGPILCLVGPPGVGKTSVGQSVARALGRKFIRTSLGGVRDEAEIRGHRRTYVGALPGRIIQSIKRVGSKNPLMMLDEIDKLRADFQGDPSAAMLEVLDPEQNKSFTDHYIDVPFDLSDVFFICTANVTDTIPPALLDRMELIEMNGYTAVEKLQIAKRHLLPKLLAEHGLQPQWITLSDATIEHVISRYTREAGVRELSRKLAMLLRGAAEEIVNQTSPALSTDIAATPLGPIGPSRPIEIVAESVNKYLGPEKFFPEVAERVPRPGVATALAWTPHGGDILFVEATTMAGKGQLTLTGQLGDVMKESAQIALSLARSTSSQLKLATYDFSSRDIHIHVPGGAIPKDGPSAGVTILAALVSLLEGRAIDPKLGMTGEITLRGAILPVGGIKEKVLAAHRAGLKTILIPKRNEQDLTGVPDEIRQSMKFSFAETIEEALSVIFPGTPGIRLVAPPGPEQPKTGIPAA